MATSATPPGGPPPPAASEREPTTPGRAKERVTLLDNLLLGTPDGKTEILEGRVYRRLACKSSSAARAVFKDIERDVCSYFGIPWRRRYAQGNAFAHDRVHVSVDDRLVWLRVAVALSLWARFA